MGIQTAAVRSLSVQGVFTTAGTFTLVALAGTFAGFRLRGEMSRLTCVLVGLVACAIAGGLLFLHARSYAPVLPVVITLVVLMIGRTMHRPQRRSELITAAYRLVDNRSWTRRHPATNVESEGGQPHPQAKEHES